MPGGSQGSEAVVSTFTKNSTVGDFQAAFIFFTERKEQGRPLPFCVALAAFRVRRSRQIRSTVCESFIVFSRFFNFFST